MSKKPQAKKLDALNDIGSLIARIRDHYAEVSRRYQNERDNAKKWDTVPVGHSLFPLVQGWREKALTMAARWKQECERCREAIATLRRLVAIQIPELDGKLREVRFRAAEWHERPASDWGPLLEELDRIEAATYRAGEPLAPKTKPQRGRHRTPLETLEAQVAEAELLGTAAYCRKYDCSPSIISKRKRQLEERRRGVK